MSLTNPNTPISEQDLKDFYEKIKPYLGTNAAPSEDMSEIVNPLPSIPTRGHKYSTEEQVVGEWIDGKPIYQKTITGNLPTANNSLQIAAAYIDKLIDYNGYAVSNIPSMVTLPYTNTPTDENSGTIYTLINLHFMNSIIYVNLRGKLVTAFENQPFVVTIQYTKTTD